MNLVSMEPARSNMVINTLVTPKSIPLQKHQELIY